MNPLYESIQGDLERGDLSGEYRAEITTAARRIEVTTAPLAAGMTVFFNAALSAPSGEFGTTSLAGRFTTSSVAGTGGASIRTPIGTAVQEFSPGALALRSEISGAAGVPRWDAEDPRLLKASFSPWRAP
jgi:hypothetical protein